MSENRLAPLRFEGFVESLRSNRISGWVLCLDRLDEPVELVLRIAGRDVARRFTSVDRGDVAQLHGSHRLAGFEFIPGADVPPFTWQDVAVLPVNADRPLPLLNPPAPTQGHQPLPDTAEGVARRSKAMHFEGYVEAVRPDRISGWALCLDRLDEPVELVLRIAGREVARRFTSVDRGDVAWGRGSHRLAGFSFVLDARVPAFSGADVAVLPVGADKPLPFMGDPASVGRSGGAAPSTACQDLSAAVLASFKDLDFPAEPFSEQAGDTDPGPSAGFARLRGNLIEGRVGYGGRQAATITIEVDGAGHPLLPPHVLDRATSPEGRFVVPLPAILANGAMHAIAVRDGPLHWLAGGPTMPALHLRCHIAGRVERIEAGIVHGWVLDARRPDEPVRLVLLDAGRVVAEHTADLAHPDVSETLCRPGAVGFALPIPRDLFDRTQHQLRLLADGTELLLADARPLWLILEAEEIATAPQRLRGRLESATAERITGWAFDAHAPDRPVGVDILIDGIAVARVEANRYEPRFRPLTGHGQNGFGYAIPLRFWTGGVRRITARIAGADQTMEGGPLMVRLPHRLLPAAPAPVPAMPTIVRPGPACAAPPGLVSAIILNRNGAALLHALFAAFAAAGRQPDLEFIVIDHGSTDGSAAVAAAFATRLVIHFEARGRNFSFSASNNLAARLAQGAFLLFLNNDIVPGAGILPAMLRRLADPMVAAVGVQLHEPVLAQDGTVRAVLSHDGVAFRLLQDAAEQRAEWFPFEIDAEARDPFVAAMTEAGAVAATAAMLLVRRSEFLAVGGFDAGYEYGLEDIDLCLRLAAGSGRHFAIERSVPVWHYRGATRGRRPGMAAEPPAPDANGRDQRNRDLFARRQAAHLRRALRAATLAGPNAWRMTPCRVGFAVTSTDPHTAAGDTFTAMELAEALGAAEGWETTLVSFAETDLRGLDVLVAMRFDVPVRRMVHATPSLLAVAWIRNRVDEWIAAGDLDAYGVVFASSRKAVETVAAETGLTAHLLPIATNPARFAPPVADRPEGAGAGSVSGDVVFTGNWWGHTRSAVADLDPATLPARFAIYGQGWENAPGYDAFWRGAVPYYDLPPIYGGSAIVLDDSDPVTRCWNSLNSRVFDAAAAGALVVTNCVGGARELLPGVLPAADSPQELRALVDHYLADDVQRQAAAGRLRAAVLSAHTYAHRAANFVTVVRQAAAAILFAIKVPVPGLAERELWGDWHFATDLARALRRLGHHVRIDMLPQWHDGISATDDVTIVLRGLSVHAPDPRCVNLLWLISHPDAVAAAELAHYDHVFVASDSHAATLRAEIGDKVTPLLQCTDPERFHPEVARPDDIAPVIFVGNSRGRLRPMVEAALRCGLDFGLYGSGWEGLVPQRLVRRSHINNAALAGYYAHADLVLNDHWEDMREKGFISNRIFDAGACGGALLSDAVQGLDVLFDNNIATWDGKDLGAAVARARAERNRRDGAREKLRRTILAAHTFDHRAREIAATACRLLGVPGQPFAESHQPDTMTLLQPEQTNLPPQYA